MDKRLIEWAVTKRGRLVENFGDPSMGAWAEMPAGVPVGAPDVRAMTDEGHCDCGCHSTGTSCGCCDAGSACPMCGKMLMTDTEEGCGCGAEYDMDESTEACDKCGGGMAAEGDYCDECGYSGMVESVILEAKKKKRRKGPSMKTQKKMAKSLAKRAGKNKEGDVSMTKLIKMMKHAKEENPDIRSPEAIAQHIKQLSKK